jgi:very-short-patch-repair endonuclease
VPARWVPEPETNVRILVGGMPYEVDCLWREQRVVVELDGAAAHEPGGPSTAIEERDAALVAGFRSMRYTWRRVARQPEAVMREVRSALALVR